MASCRTEDLKNFENGGQFPICVRYLGRGPDCGEIPDHVLERRNPISGKLTFSMHRVSFYCERNVLTSKCKHISGLRESFSRENVDFNYPMYLVKCEKLSEDDKILYLVLHPGISTYDQRRIYFDVSDPKNKCCTVYYPQWVDAARRLNRGDVRQQIADKSSEFFYKISR